MLCLSGDNQKSKHIPYFLSDFQNDILTENMYNVEIKVDPPAEGNAADTVSGNDAAQ